MKISLNWLNDYIETGLDAEGVAELLSDLGFPCEGIEYSADDAVIDVEITSNRGDCLGYIGVARELAVVTSKELKLPVVEPAESEKAVTEFVDIRIAEPDLCHRYTAGVIEGVKVGPCPEWMSKRLEAVGMRSVNNVVDATNYAMLETGQPPHAFDYDKLSGGKIVVRKALAGERIVSIDGSKCELETDMLIIADGRKPVAIAGVMGGLDTEVSESTTTILLEEAYFDPVSVRRTSRRLALPSEASFRFERIVDAEMIDWASKRTGQLITAVAGGTVAKGLVDVYPKRAEKVEVTLRLSRLKKVLGIEVPAKEVIRILSGLSFSPRLEGDLAICIRPSWRSDVHREADLIEEVARVYGYNKIPTEQKIQIEVVAADARQQLTESIGSYLNGCGFYETINVTFVDDATTALFQSGAAGGCLGVKDVSRKNANLLRQSLLGSLFGVLKTNLNAGNTPCRIFEIADTFLAANKSAALPIEKTMAAMVCDSDLREMRGVVEGLIKSVDKTAEIVFEPANLCWAQAGARILVNGRSIGAAGVACEAVKERFDLKDVTVVAAELEIESLMSLLNKAFKVKPIPRFPAIDRDLSVIVDERVAWDDIAEAVNKKAPEKLEDIKFVGIYRGKGIAAGQKSVTLSLRFRDEDGTLTHQTVDRFEADIVKSLSKSVGAQLRTA